MRPTVVFALQSPTLLNALSRSRRWQLEVADLGDHPGQEAELLEAPRYRGGPVDHVFACSPEHWRRAREEFPRAKLWWLIHNGQPHLIPRDIEPERAVALSRRVAAMQGRVRPELPIHLVVPSYEPRRVWQWGRGCWTMISRPATRHPEHLRCVQRVRQIAQVEHVLCGEGQPGGFLYPDGRERKQRSCAAYLSALPKWSGFGLAEHECLAAGVPIVGSRWGDMPEEMPDDYAGLDDAPEVQALVLRDLCDPVRGPELGEELSQVGLDFIAAHRKLERMEVGIQGVLES